MKTILLTISYDGTDFCGWQKQDNVRTVQEEIEKALTIIHKNHTEVYGSGRTDSGVHAVGQAAHFISPIDSMPTKKYVPALNSLLPQDIRIMGAVEKPDGFHARFSATSRTYRYFIDCSMQPPAHALRYTWSIRRKPNITRLNKMASYLRGELDFTTFAAASDESPSRCRYIEEAVFFIDGSQLVFQITGNAFLWKMVRSLTGTLLYFDAKDYNPDYFAKVLTAKDRSLCGPTAPSEGLFLWNISFDGIRRN